MSNPKYFKWPHYEPEIILWCVRWYAKTALTYRNIQEMLAERNLPLAHTPIMRWVHYLGPKIKDKLLPHLKKTNDSWRLDETYLKIKGKWKYLYRAVDFIGNTLDFMLSARRIKKAAKRFFKKILGNFHVKIPRIINVDKQPVYLPALELIKQEESFFKQTSLRRRKCLNNVVEADHRFVKRKVRYKQWFQTFYTAQRTIAAYESMNIINKGQVRHLSANDPKAQKIFLEKLFNIAA